MSGQPMGCLSGQPIYRMLIWTTHIIRDAYMDNPYMEYLPGQSIHGILVWTTHTRDACPGSFCSLAFLCKDSFKNVEHTKPEMDDGLSYLYNGRTSLYSDSTVASLRE
ncbi:hypothetical protein RRG08_009024 [Elysia crispata]|uniref:Uncharacterized protein n=1 Tax=Elysia crispata TaxID=231223 RepID=A0AAE1AI47_9GAST|nr:hypothetical protein RRG08_009024 [Elysia crispata]